MMIIGIPVQHRATASALFNKPVAEVWRALTAFEEHPQWRTGLKAVERIRTDGTELVKEISKKGETMTFETVEVVPQQRLIRRIADKNLPFGGTWTFSLEPQNGRTRLTIIEDGEVYNLIFRFVSKYIMGHHATIKTFLKDLGKYFGEQPQIQLGQ